MIIPKGTRTELVLWAGEMCHVALIWVQTDKGWQCYTTLPGVNNYGRVASYDCETSDGVLSAIKNFCDNTRWMDESARLTLKAAIRAEAGAPTWGAGNS